MRNKQGISLIVLVITIIVMTVLVASVVLTLSNTGIINKANQAVEDTNLGEVKQHASLVWAEEFMSGKRGTTLQDVVLEKLKAYLDRYTITVTDSGVTVEKGGAEVTTNVPEEWKASVSAVTKDGVPIPKGFVASPYTGEGEKNLGLVVYALTEDEIDNGVKEIPEGETYQESLETRNQFVWVPVNSNEFTTLFRRKKWEQDYGYDIQDTVGEEGVWEITLDQENMPTETQNSEYVSEETRLEAIAMYASVKKYGGFYIGRYEVGIDVGDGTTSGELTSGELTSGEGGSVTTSITMGNLPYNWKSWVDEYNNDGVWSKGAVNMSRDFYPSTNTKYGAISTLTYGVQFDRTLSWWKELNSSIDLTDSIAYGNYTSSFENRTITINMDEFNDGAKYSSDMGGTYSYITDTLTEISGIFSTGAYKNACVFNIYDLAGNVDEWSMEGTEDYRVRRDPIYEGKVVRVNCTWDGNFEGGYHGFRPSLYIK